MYIFDVQYALILHLIELQQRANTARPNFESFIFSAPETNFFMAAILEIYILNAINFSKLFRVIFYIIPRFAEL